MLFRLIFIISGLFYLALSEPVHAHEVRPAALTLTQKSDGFVDVVWKQPIISGRRLKIDPVLPSDCQKPETTEQNILGDAVVERWTTQCSLDQGSITISDLDQTLTDVFVQIAYSDGRSRTEILRPAYASFKLDGSSGSAVSEYLLIGAEHMLFGWDHLLFVLGLILLTPVRKLLWVITAFTIGHSVTLAVTALGLFTLPSGPVELLIALSIFFLAVEAARKYAGHSSLTIRKPWLIALMFGLLHGLGFAGALADIGLPKGEELWALLLFNLGVEAGQILFVAIILSLFWIFRRISLDSRKWIELPTLYLVGGMGAYYTLGRIFT